MSLELRRQRIYAAHRAGLRNRIRDEWHQPEERADRLIDEWELEATTRGLERDAQGFWSEAEEWVRGRLGR